MMNTIIENTNLYIAEKDITVYIPVKFDKSDNNRGLHWQVIGETCDIKFKDDGYAEKYFSNYYDNKELCNLIEETKQKYKLEDCVNPSISYHICEKYVGIPSYLNADAARNVAAHYNSMGDGFVITGYIHKGTRYYNGWGKVESEYSPSIDRDILNYSIPKIISEKVWAAPSYDKSKRNFMFYNPYEKFI